MTLSFPVARALAQHRYAEAAEHLRRGAAKAQPDSATLALIAFCEFQASMESDGVATAKEALRLEPENFEANRLLAEHYVRVREQELAQYHLRVALRSHESVVVVPSWLRWFTAVLVFIRTGFRHWSRVRTRMLDRSDYPANWVKWAREYLRWADSTGISGGAVFPVPAPKANYACMDSSVN